MPDRSQRMVWVDLEMTGLDEDRCSIVEIATIVTESDLSIVAEGPCLVIHQPEEALATMTEFVRDLHTRSGLLDRIRASTVSLSSARDETLAFLAKHCEPGKSPLCGNSVWKDRAFLQKGMPEILSFLHYRIIDVSTIKELVRRWCPAKEAPKKREVHRALEDIRESIAELRWYRDRIFPMPDMSAMATPIPGTTR
ncbi:oligoribonuclease [Chondromyces apiculatus]|uniref:Oligoribonuclease n=1 Tax=Chondromyces apiculatus DSM 436 TaxID=1192034 RepID=A0A017T1V5_9BACT|nr:oligoribonuclease [Chondromyces apiculatus]EYF02962.1 3'-to-5' oligoribonuclease (orn) [Chondromyces apiculatus DSM 436]